MNRTVFATQNPGMCDATQTSTAGPASIKKLQFTASGEDSISLSFPPSLSFSLSLI